MYICMYVLFCFVLFCLVCCDVQVSTVVLAWASEHYYDFEGLPEMEDFLDWFEQRLIEDVRSNVSLFLLSFV